MVYKDYSHSIHRSLAALARWSLDTLLPSRCLICSQITQLSGQMCQTCETLLNQANSRQFECCLRCDVRLERPASGAVFAAAGEIRPQDGALHCAQCLRRADQYQKCVSATIYNPLTGKLVNQLKHQRQLAAVAPIATAMRDALKNHYRNPPAHIDLAIPVPLHPRRLQLRGFNQANEIARRVCQYFNIPLSQHLCLRIRDNIAQQSMGLKARQKNLLGAFAINPAALQRQPISGKHIAIIDDVMTTGATANAVASCLMAAGAKRCDIWCYARTPRLK